MEQRTDRDELNRDALRVMFKFWDMPRALDAESCFAASIDS